MPATGSPSYDPNSDWVLRDCKAGLFPVHTNLPQVEPTSSPNNHEDNYMLSWPCGGPPIPALQRV